MRIILLLLLPLISFRCLAQDLSGIWRGHFISGNATRTPVPQGLEDRYKFEVQLSQKDKIFKGVTYSYKTTVFYGKATCYGAVNRQTKKVFLEEIKITELKTIGNDACIMTCFLQYSKVDSEEVLEGHYTSMNARDSTQCGEGTVFLRRVETSDFYKEPFLVEKTPQKKAPVQIKPLSPSLRPPAPAAAKKTTPVTAKKTTPVAAAKPPVKPKTLTAAKPMVKPKPSTVPRPSPKAPVVVAPKKADNLKTMPEDSVKKMLGKAVPSILLPRVLATRQNELVKTITTSSKNISVKIYDNGTIDNDTVSVYVDKKLVVSKARLTENAIVVNLTIDGKSDVHELVMVAENLGEIPPNTSLMVVTAGEQQYEVRITSTEQKNAVVLFKYGPDPKP